MANSYEIIDYKQTAMSLIINNEKIVELIDAHDIEDSDDLIYERVFPFLKIPETEEEQKTYIMMYIDTPTNRNVNNLMKDAVITFVVTTHQSLMRVLGKAGNRIDLLAHEIDKQFNGFELMGVGELNLVSNIEGSVDRRHPCRTIKFTVAEFDDPRRGYDVA